MTPEKEKNLRGKVREHLEFIDSSSNAFDQGRQSEALRIAVSLRVLFHQTGASHALVNQLGASNVKVLSTRGGPPPEFVDMMKRLGAQELPFQASLVLLSIGASPTLKAPLGDLPPPCLQQVPLQQWLDETVFVSGQHRATRYDLFKWAANKDGGAHVEPGDLPAAYEAYKASGAVGTVTIGGRQFPFENAHLVALRQMGYEVLNSPEVAALAA